jgi:hypothetical protein
MKSTFPKEPATKATKATKAKNALFLSLPDAGREKP